MPTLVMSWVAETPFGDLNPHIEIRNNPTGIMVPPDACGFRLERPGQLWPDYWAFLEGDGFGAEAETGVHALSSGNPEIAPTDVIEARGPVGGCAGGGGNYVFVTPLGGLGISLTFPTLFDAGSFVADFSTEEDITWLDADGTAIVVTPPSASVPTATLPPEFFEQPPSVKGCFRDFEGKLHCPVDTSSAGQATADEPGMVSLLMGRNAGVLPGMGVTAAIATPPISVASGEPLEVICPVELRLEVQFVKAPDVPPGNVRYRFRFAHGPMSTTFSRDVIEDGITSVVHSVPLPLPDPIAFPGGRPGGGQVGPATNDLAIFRPPLDPLPPGNASPQGPGMLTAEPLPDNQIKGSVRVEVVNSTTGIIASGWATYHLICAPGSGRGRVTPGLVGSDVLVLQSGLNRWLEEQDLPALVLDGTFARETERVVRQFQGTSGLTEDGSVGPATWHALMREAR